MIPSHPSWFTDAQESPWGKEASRRRSLSRWALSLLESTTLARDLREWMRGKKRQASTLLLPFEPLFFFFFLSEKNRKTMPYFPEGLNEVKYSKLHDMSDA